MTIASQGTSAEAQPASNNEDRDKTQLGELFVSALDDAARHSSDPRQVLRVAALAVLRATGRGQKPAPRQPPKSPTRRRGVRHWWLGRSGWPGE